MGPRAEFGETIGRTTVCAYTPPRAARGAPRGVPGCVSALDPHLQHGSSTMVRIPRIRATTTAGVTLAAATLAACSQAPDDPARADDAQAVAESAARRTGHARALRELIDRQVGGIAKLKVPADDASIPLPPEDPARPGRYKTTEAKRFLGKLLFHDPVRTARINANTAQPLDLPAGTGFGGTLDASRYNIDAIVAGQKQTGSCGSCHFGEAASKAGDVINLHVGAEGRGYTDEHGDFIVRRRVQSVLPKLRTQPLFAGDALVDAFPTLTDIYQVGGQRVVTTPALFYHSTAFPGCVAAGVAPLTPSTILTPCTPPPDALLATGRLDDLDSVGRLSMSMIGFAFNNRLLFGGFGGEPATTIGSLNPFRDPAGENITLLLLDAHRMLDFQVEPLQGIAAFVKLFQDAFPEEATAAAAAGTPKAVVNNDTVFRATATFLRTVVTRNTPFDHFLAGDDHALTARQRRGAELFFTSAQQGGAGCVTCHSGPMLNKQINDPDVAGIGALVEENFINVGIGDHPVQALNAVARGLDKATHGIDTGRFEVTGNPDHRYKFRSLTLRQLKDARNFFHNGSFSTVRDVVNYFNRGVAQDPVAGAAATLDPRFTHPRGPTAAPGLGLSDAQVDALTDFLENGLYDPAFVHHDPRSTTRTFQPNADDLAFSRHHPELIALGAVDGQLLSHKNIDNDDPLSRRDAGIEFLDVTAQVGAARLASDRRDGRQVDTYRLTNHGGAAVDTHLLVVAHGLPRGARVTNASGTSRAGDPYRRLFLEGGVLPPGQSVDVAFEIERERDHRRDRDRDDDRAPLDYTLTLLSGQGQP
jgi:hypothetical protein